MAYVYGVESWTEINVTSSVGVGGVNSTQDVLVVQALLKYVGEKISYFRNENLPRPTGVMDKKTQHLIKKYQQYVRRVKKVGLSVDGRIDPSKGLYVPGKKLQWTIGQLNGDASQIHMMFGRNGGDHVEDLCTIYPPISAILDGSAVGSLNLGLE